jgi:hypothetical protein
MALTINLPQSIEQELRQDAALKGMSLDTFIQTGGNAFTPQRCL